VEGEAGVAGYREELSVPRALLDVLIYFLGKHFLVGRGCI